MRASDVEGALLREVARILREPADDLDPSRSLSELGLDSLGYCTVSAFVERQFGIAVPPEELFEFSSVQATAAHVADLAAGQRTCGACCSPTRRPPHAWGQVTLRTPHGTSPSSVLR